MLREGCEDKKLLLETEFTDCYSAVNPLVAILKTSPDTEDSCSLQPLLAPQHQEEAPRPRFVKPEAASAAKPGTAAGLVEDKTCSRPSLALPKFSDPYDAYLYQSYHITTPVVTPTLLFPTDTQPSYISTRHTAEQLFRRASHGGKSSKHGAESQGSRPGTDLLHVPISRSRTRGASLPDNLFSQDLYTLRKFSRFGNKVINDGDRVIKSRTSSFNSDCSSSGLRNCSSSGEAEDAARGPVYTVLVVGGQGVGKSSLCSQFVSAENINTYELAQDQGQGGVHRRVGMEVDGQESTFSFIDHQHGEHEVEALVTSYRPHAVVVVMAVDDFSSYLLAQNIIERITRVMAAEQHPIILVANKADMVRSRKVKASLGKELATLYSIKYIETSSGINHNIDELLVGLHTQIQLRLGSTGAATRRRNSSFSQKVGSFLGGLLARSGGQAKSCSNLSVI